MRTTHVLALFATIAMLACSGAKLAGGGKKKEDAPHAPARAGSESGSTSGSTAGLDDGGATEGAGGDSAGTSGTDGGGEPGGAGGDTGTGTAGADDTNGVDSSGADDGPPDAADTAAELAMSVDNGVVSGGKDAGLKVRIVACKTKHIQTYSGGSEAWGCTAQCDAGETLGSGGLNFGKAEKAGWRAAPAGPGQFACTINIKSCTDGTSLSSNGCSTTCHATCLSPAITVRQTTCATTRIASFGATESWGCHARCQAGEAAVSGGASFGSAFNNGIALVPSTTSSYCAANISDCSGGLDLHTTGCGSTCSAGCAKAATPNTTVKSRVTSCDFVKQASDPSKYGCVATCDRQREVVVSGGIDIGAAVTHGFDARPTLSNAYACAAQISRCTNDQRVNEGACGAKCYATCASVQK